ncbi:MAG TPA: hypothetical protein PLD59_11475 [Tepidisphaeraceae bacterium]|nr:hypothetical protein [Tepidisphaeraceae bacterium]
MILLAAVQVPNVQNWVAGWAFILLAFLTGAMIGMRFHQPQFLGGYDSFRRRMFRLGHIALAALGMLNVLYGLSPVFAPHANDVVRQVAALGLISGAVAMPVVCFLTGWKPEMRRLFFIPVLSLLAAVTAILIGGLS